MVLTHIERSMRDGCSPGLHRTTLDPANTEFEQCQDCGRRQRRDGTTCVICDCDARERFLLVNRARSTAIEGAVCVPCGREFAFRGEVHGWAIQRYARAS